MKEEKAKSTRVIIYGQPYVLKGDASTGHIHQVTELVDRKMHEIGDRNAKLDHTKIAVLAAINIADELLKVKKELEDLYRLMDQDQGEQRRKG